jgi:putative copper resistance protein D
MTSLFVITRAVHIGACLLFFGIFAFDCLIASAMKEPPPEITTYWKKTLRLFSLILLPVIFLSGIGWLLLVAATMSGQSPGLDILKIVLSQTEFGTVWKIRLVILVISIFAAVAFRFLRLQSQKTASLLQMFLGGSLLGNLAWAGHGQESSPWHLVADVLHLLGAGLWPAGLLPLFLLLRQSHRQVADAGKWLSLTVLVHRFSAVSLAAVSLLIVTGLVNSWFLVGTISNLFSQPYGRWLLAKAGFFCVAMVIASVNLTRLKPRLTAQSAQPGEAALTVAQLQTNVQIEIILSTIIIIIVAILGILPPANH